MKIIDYKEGTPESLELTLKNGKTVLGEMFDGERIDWKTIPEGTYIYFIEHTEKDFSEPLYIRKIRMNVNFMGSFVTKEDIDFGDEDELKIEDYNWIL